MKRLIVLPLVCAFFVPTPAYAVEPGSGLISYTMSANAPGLAIEGLYKDVGVTIPETTSTLSTGGVGAGLASLAWPGPIAGNLGTTILVLEGSAPPQVTALNDPVRAESRSGGTQKASYTALPGTVMQSSATHDKVTAASHTGSTGLPIGTLGAFSGGSSITLTGANAAVAEATSHVQDLSLASGLIKIGSITSTVHATNDGLTSSSTGGTVVSGFTIAGIPVAIDDKGLHVQSTTLPLATDAVTNAVKALGLTALVTKPRVVRQGSSVSENAGALVLIYTQGSNHYALTIGRAAVSLSSTRAPVLPSFPVPSLPGVTPISTVTAPGTVPGAISSLPGVTGGVPPAVSQPAPTGVAGVINTVQAAVVGLAGGASGIAVAGLLLLAGLLVFGLKLLPDRVLEVSASECEEWPR